MSETIYSNIIKEMVWSHSRVASYHDCKYKWYLKYLYGVEEKEQFFASYGSLIHRLLEMRLKSGVKVPILANMFLLEYNLLPIDGCPSEKIRTSYFKKGLDFLKSLSRKDYFPAMEIVGVEKKIDFEIDGFKFTGFIDLIGKTDDGYVILDHKSRDLKPRSNRKKPTKSDAELDEYLRQLYLYATWVKDTYGEFPKKLMFNCFKEQIIIVEDFDYEKWKEAIAWYVGTIHSIISETDYYPSIEYFKCRNLCECHDECDYYGMETW